MTQDNHVAEDRADRRGLPGDLQRRTVAVEYWGCAGGSATATPFGPGDNVEVRIDGVGSVANPIIAAED